MELAIYFSAVGLLVELVIYFSAILWPLEIYLEGKSRAEI